MLSTELFTFRIYRTLNEARKIHYSLATNIRYLMNIFRGFLLGVRRKTTKSEGTCDSSGSGSSKQCNTKWTVDGLNNVYVYNDQEI